MGAGVLFDFAAGDFVGAGGPVGAITRDGVVGVDDGEDAGAEADLFALEAGRVAAAVPLFLVVERDEARALEPTT